MTPQMAHRWVLLFVLASLGCRQEASRWDAAQEASQGKPAVSKESVTTGVFNKFFPQVADPFDLVYKQDKTGFAEASLKHDGKEVAILSVSDTRNNPSAAEKYQNAEKLGDYPVAAIGTQGTGILVANRYQVQVRSADPAFSEDDRKAWLQQFDLAGLSQLP